VKKEARLSAKAMAQVKESKGEENLRCRIVFIVSQRRRGLSEDEETRLEQYDTIRYHTVYFMCSKKLAGSEQA